MPRSISGARALAMGLTVVPAIFGWRTCTAAEQVDLALVLVSDVSRSIDDTEFDLEKQGYARAFTDPRVIEAIASGPAGQVAIMYMEFASAAEVRTVVDWTVLRDASSAADFAGAVLAEPRSFAGRPRSAPASTMPSRRCRKTALTRYGESSTCVAMAPTTPAAT